MLDDTKNTFPIAAVGFLFNPLTREVFLHRRDDKTLYYPNKIAFFG